MKEFKKYLITACIIVAALYGALYLSILFLGKTILISRLKELTKKDVSIGHFVLRPPFNIYLEKLDIKDLARADSISISPSAIGFLTGNIVFNSITVKNPEVVYERAMAGRAQSSAAVSSVATGAGKEKSRLRLFLKRARIENGKVIFIDHSTGEKGIKLIVEEIDFRLDNLGLLPRSMRTNFKLQGRVPWQRDGYKGKITAEGWFNIFKKDMQAALKFEDIDGVYLYPYYSQWVDLDKARIESAKLQFTSDIEAVDNDLTAKCRVELTDIVRRQRLVDEEPGKEEKIADAVLDVFRILNQGGVVFNFTIRTKMNSPQFSAGDIKEAFDEKVALAKAKKRSEFKVENVFAFPVRFLEGLAEGALELSRAAVDGTYALGKELKDSVEIAFTKEE
ncbi:DUF748 domain-containing protein [Candidatus Omnitrophota bacterium]